MRLNETLAIFIAESLGRIGLEELRACKTEAERRTVIESIAYFAIRKYLEKN